MLIEFIYQLIWSDFSSLRFPRSDMVSVISNACEKSVDLIVLFCNS